MSSAKKSIHKILLVIFLFFALSTSTFSQVHPLANAHSHNDYKQKHPLTDALNNGFLSIEADVFLIKGQLIVSHVHPFFKKGTLEELYLKPLSDTIKRNGSIYKGDSRSLILLVELKSASSPAYKVLDDLLFKYRNIVTRYENGKLSQRPITVIITGNKPYADLQKQSTRYAFIDQNFLMMNDSISKSVCPLASTKYSNVLRWKGKGKIPKDEEQKLKDLVTLAHAQGKKVRLWASPENKNVWQALLDNGVDLINTNELEDLKKFLTESGK